MTQTNTKSQSKHKCMSHHPSGYGNLIFLGKGLNPCVSNACSPHGTCYEVTRNVDQISFNCVCAPGYTGTKCEIGKQFYDPKVKMQNYKCIALTEIDECISGPCENSGTCIDLVNAYECQCSVDYHGINCQFGMLHHI